MFGLWRRCRPGILSWLGIACLGVAGAVNAVPVPPDPGPHPCRLEDSQPAIPRELAASATLSGSLEVGSGVDLPKTLGLRVAKVPEKGSSDGFCGAKELVIDCSLDGPKFRCQLPAGRLDLKLEAPPMAPVYRWGVSASASQNLDLGKVRLVPGASLAGWLEPAVPLPPGVRPRVKATRHLLGEFGSVSEASRVEILSQEAEVSSTLFFQFVGLSPGAWDLAVEAPGFAMAKRGPVSIESSSETLLSESLELHPPASLSIYLEPATDWDGKPWRVLLKRSKAFSPIEELTVDRKAGLQGDLQLTDLEPGEYRLEILDEREGSWLEQLVEVRPGMPPLFLDLPAIEAAGELLLGSQAIAGTVVFGAYERPRIPVTTDEEGRFQALLPRAGKWPLIVEVGNLEVRLESIEIGKNGERNLTIRLPDTKVRGKVYLDGERAPKASVILRRDSGDLRPLGSVVTDEKGEFEFVGLPEGALRAVAVIGKQSSEWVRTELQEKAPAEIELRITKTRPVKGRVTLAGAPSPGAAVIALYGEAGPFPAAQQALSGADGGLAFDLPATARTFDLLAFAPGRSVVWLRRPVPPEGSEIEIPLPTSTGQLSLQGPGETFDTWYLSHGESRLPFRVIYRWLIEAGAVDQRLSDLAFQLRGVEAGSYTFCAQTSAGLEACVSGDLAAGGALELDLCGRNSAQCKILPAD